MGSGLRAVAETGTGKVVLGARNEGRRSERVSGGGLTSPTTAHRSTAGPAGLPRTLWRTERQHGKSTGKCHQRRPKGGTGCAQVTAGYLASPPGLLLSSTRSPGPPPPPPCCPNSCSIQALEPQQALLAWLPGCPTIPGPHHLSLSGLTLLGGPLAGA